MNNINLISTKELNELKVWKPHKYILYGIMNIVLIVLLAFISISINNAFVYLLCWLLQGTIFIAYSNAAHECTHDMMTPNKKMNRLLGSFWMTPLLINFTVHKNYHLKHHANTTCEGDPEYNFEYDVFPNLKSYFLNMAKWLTIYDPLHRLNWRHSLSAIKNEKTDLLTSDSKIKKAKHDFISLLIWICFCVMATIFFPWQMIAGYWIPVCIFMPITAYITAVPEHYDVKYGRDSLSNTRTIRTNPIISLLFWHFNFHTAHHYNPSVPFYSLPKLHKKISSKIKYNEKSYLGFHHKTIHKILKNKAVD
jgi:fatty acid desaturase